MRSIQEYSPHPIGVNRMVDCRWDCMYAKRECAGYESINKRFSITEGNPLRCIPSTDSWCLVSWKTSSLYYVFCKYREMCLLLLLRQMTWYSNKISYVHDLLAAHTCLVFRDRVGKNEKYLNKLIWRESVECTQ